MTEGKSQELVVHHELEGVTPEMIDWWWDNIDTTERYAMWHPGSHLSFEWEAVEGEGEAWVVGVQWHPEWLIGSSGIMLQLFSAFAEACRSVPSKMHRVGWTANNHDAP